MGEIVARFADGKLLVEEDKAAESNNYISGIGLPVRIAHVRVVDKVLSVDAYVSGKPGAAGAVLTPLREVTTSGDTIFVVMRRLDLPMLLSGNVSGTLAYGNLSGLTSGKGYLEELASGLPLSGLMRIRANVIAY